MARTWILAALGLAAFAVLVWLAGPLIELGGTFPLASPQARLVVVVLFALQYLAQKLWQVWRSRQANDRIVAELKPTAETGLSAEAAALRDRFATALEQLRRARFAASGIWQFGRSYLYQLPWYVIIGAPGAGKTTALLNSGLSFPLAEKLGRAPVGGFGGTRHCDWWFTDRAVLIDTAGRYTTQESDRVGDRHAWKVFLQLLLRSRPQRPLDGVLVAVSVGDLLEFDAERLAEHSRALRARLDELQDALRVRIPVYVLLTKCDLLPGFVDWFGGFSRGERDQVWGVTFERRVSDPGAGAADFAGSFDRLANRLADGLLGRLQAERDPQRRGRILALPGQLRGLAAPLTALIQGTFAPSTPSAGDATTMLRGVYLTSGTQQGTPIDRMLSAFGRELGLERQILPPNQNTGKSFFLAGVLNDVVLTDADLRGGSSPRERWRRRLVLASMLATQLAALALATGWITGYLRSAREIRRLEGEVATARAVLEATPTTVDPDPRPLLPALDAMRALARDAARTRGSSEVLDVGARSRRKLATAARVAYERALQGPFQARIVGAIDATMRTGADVNVQYEALKAYELLSDAGHFDAAGLRVFVMSYWNSALSPPWNTVGRSALADHLDAWLAAGAVGTGIRLEPVLVDAVRRRLISQSVAERIALRLEILLDAHPYPDFSVASLAPGAATLFVGADGRSEPIPVPGRYTIESYGGLVIPQVAELARELGSESTWVLGAPAATADTDVATVMAGYRTAYAQAWTRLLDDLRLKPAANNQDAVRQAQALGEPGGVLRQVLAGIVRQTPVRLQDGGAGPIAEAEPRGARFASLAGLVARTADGRSPLDAAMQSFLEIARLRSAVAAGTSPVATTAAPGERLAHIIADASGEPEPVRSMLLSLAVLPSAGAAPISRASTASLSRQIATGLGVACIQLVAGRFPFDRRATREASLEDFSRLFGPRGTFDEVFTRLLASRVDTSSGTWRARAPGSGPDADELERFRAAARIRDVFFPHRGSRPAFRLTFRPLDLDPEIDRFQLEIDGQVVRYAHGPPVATTVTWPGPRHGARIEVTPASGSAPLEYEGPWALFRLLDHAAIQEAGSPERFRVVFDVGGRHASFDVETDDGANPFRLRELEHFDCPIPGQ